MGFSIKTWTPDRSGRFGRSDVQIMGQAHDQNVHAVVQQLSSIGV
jgi:hypothetical protein